MKDNRNLPMNKYLAILLLIVSWPVFADVESECRLN